MMKLSRYSSLSNGIFLPFVIISLSMACTLVTLSFRSITLSDCYKITFLGFTENGNGTSTWRYQVEELTCAQDLSNWMLELPICANVVDASPSPWEVVQPDPNFQLNGIKWQTGTGFESGEFSVMLSGELIDGTVHVGVKGPDVATGLIAGPACDLSVTVTPAFTSSPSPTVSADLTPTLPLTPVASNQP